ncbi:MAG TPA: glycerophosphodiester phosphodiesterase [Caulobacterales bacterium]|nr:glycerophosphodiester phosphodiesterase [Caulobacterales bacterium]
MRRRDALIGAAALGACAGMRAAEAKPPVVIAHRGASGERPEHTMAAYARAIDQGADYIEPDLVLSKDGVLICRHENEISGTTDVAGRAEFAARRTTKLVDGASVSGWFAENFTLAELKTLRCRERLPELRPQNTVYDGLEQIPTFAEALALARSRGVGVYPELKHPSFLSALGLPPVEAFLAAVREGGGQTAADAMFVQCFEAAPLVQLASISSLRFRTIQLMSVEGGPWDQSGRRYAEMAGDAGLREIAGYAHGIGVEKGMIVPRDAAARSLPPTDLIERAHRAGLAVHAWTFRAENYFLPAELRRGDSASPDYPRLHGDLEAELRQFYALGLDGAFCDFPAIALSARS